MDFIFLQRIETEESKQKWAIATKRVNDEYDRIMAQMNLQHAGVTLTSSQRPTMPQYTMEEGKARDFSEAYLIKRINGASKSEPLPNLREMVTLDDRTYIVTNREFYYHGGSFQSVYRVYFEVHPYDEPLPDEAEIQLRMYGNTPPLHSLKIVSRPVGGN